MNLSIGEIWRVTPMSYLSSQLGQMNLHAKVLSVTGVPTDEDLADAADALFAPLLKPWMSTNTTYIGTVVERVWPIPLESSVASAVHAGAGTATTGSNLPTQCSGLLTLRSGLRGKSFNGRAYVPFPALTMANTAGDVDPAAAVILGNLLGALNSSLNVGAGPGVVEFGIYSRVLSTTSPVFSVITSASGFGLGFATQRRRGFYGRPNIEPSL